MPAQSNPYPYIRRFHQAFTPESTIRVNRLHTSTHGHQAFRPLPAPTGPLPYHLTLDQVLTADQMTAITNAGSLIFHLVGDTGGVKNPDPQTRVAERMLQDFGDGKPNPAFFYHLGDVVYFYGEAEQYYPQFYEPYDQYPAPIFAIPGNHDGDLSPTMEKQGTASLAAFVNNFCTPIPHHTQEALDAPRSSMNQPNVYWTLETPFVTFIGLYTNVPEGGQLDDSQILWLNQELTTAPTDRALLLCMHHPIYSVDDYHSGSVYMETVLTNAITQTGRIPDAVFAGHVHNYQRFTHTIQGRSVPFIVAGAGGYHNLHAVSQSLKDAGQPPIQVPDAPDVTIEAYSDDTYGYLVMEASSTTLQGQYFTVPKNAQDGNGQTAAFDTFTLDLRKHTVS